YAFAITGNFQQSTNGQVIFNVGGPSAQHQFEELDVGLQATLGGTLLYSLVNSYTTTVNDADRLFQFGASSGAFATISTPVLPGGLNFNPLIDANSLT